MERTDVVTCFCRHEGEVLLLRRAPDAETYPGKWGTVTGYLEHDDPIDTARMEIREETGLEEVTVARRGEPFGVVDEDLDREWRIHPFLYDVTRRSVRTNEDRAEWTTPTAIHRRDAVPKLWESYDRVRPTPESIAADDEHGSAWLSVRALEVLRDEAGLAAVRDRDLEAVHDVATELVEARASMAAVRNRVNRAVSGANTPREVERAAIAGIERGVAADSDAAARAAELLEGHVLTLSRSGTVLETLRAVEGPVTVAESRPAREGVGVAEALAGGGRTVRLCTDAAVGHVLASGDVDAVLVGADTILADGRVVNKTGTRAAALLSEGEGVPCYVVAAAAKVSPDAAVHLESGDPGAVYGGEADVEAVNPTFDVTPASAVERYVTERGVLETDDVEAVATEFERLEAWRAPEDDGHPTKP